MTMSDELQDFLRSKGAGMVGYADLRSIAPDICENLPFGISIAVALNPNIISKIQDGPTREYFVEYERANILLDDLGHYVAEFLLKRGH